MGIRPIPTDIPGRVGRGRSATVRSQITTTDYVLDFGDGIGGPEVGYYTGQTDIPIGTRVKSNWRPEVSSWEIQFTESLGTAKPKGTIRTAASATITNDDTLGADSVLKAAVSANTLYSYEGYFFLNAFGSAVAGKTIIFNLFGPTNFDHKGIAWIKTTGITLGSLSEFNQATGSGNSFQLQLPLGSPVADDPDFISFGIRGYLDIVTAAGDVQCAFAQNVAATTWSFKVGFGSWFRVEPFPTFS